MQNSIWHGRGELDLHLEIKCPSVVWMPSYSQTHSAGLHGALKHLSKLEQRYRTKRFLGKPEDASIDHLERTMLPGDLLLGRGARSIKPALSPWVHYVMYVGVDE